MSIFSKILDKLGIGKDKKAEEEAAQAEAVARMAKSEAEARARMQKEAAAKAAAAPKATTPQPAAAPAAPAVPQPAAQPVAPAPTPISQVDVVSKLEALASGKGLNWKTSIADLLVLLELDHSKAARIELAKELGCPPEYISGDLSKMNVWLHKTVLQKIAENGGNIPQELLD